jgi:hypothetical protein
MPVDLTGWYIIRHRQNGYLGNGPSLVDAPGAFVEGCKSLYNIPDILATALSPRTLGSAEACNNSSVRKDGEDIHASRTQVFSQVGLPWFPSHRGSSARLKTYDRVSAPSVDDFRK